MDHQVLFTEKQRFSQWWVWLILLGINGFFIFGIFKQVIGGQQFGDKPMSNAGLIIVTAVVISISFLFTKICLETVITPEGIYVRFFPIHLSFYHYRWENITKCYVREYNPLKEYGGWGLRIGLSGKGQAFNISGNTGLQLEFKNNDKLLIGTNKPEELAEALSKLGQLR